MNLAVIRAALLPQRALLRTGLFVALGVVAIVAGLLAMHTLSPSVPSHSPAAGIAVMDQHLAQPVEMSSSQTGSDECGSGCEPMNAMGLMACLLVLMAISMIAVAVLPAARWFNPHSHISSRTAARIFTTSLSPPSLEKMCISRT